ncbi:hypothetical protein ACRAWF_20945 [Streptomyces sp. L7]
MVVEPLHRYLLRRASTETAEDVLSRRCWCCGGARGDVPGLGDDVTPDPDDVLPGATGWLGLPRQRPPGRRGAGSVWWSG